MEEEIKDVEKLMIIRNDLRRYKGILSKASDEILDRDVSKYPIFVLHKQKIALGVPLILREKHDTNWSVHVSTLEEFSVKKLILKNKIDAFRNTYKNPRQFLCIFVLSDIGAQFLFIPRKTF